MIKKNLKCPTFPEEDLESWVPPPTHPHTHINEHVSCVFGSEYILLNVKTKLAWLSTGFYAENFILS